MKLFITALFSIISLQTQISFADNRPTNIITQKNGKELVYGNKTIIMEVATYVFRKGKVEIIPAKGITTPNANATQSVRRTMYQFPEKCQKKQFSYYQGNGFQALGYHHRGVIILDAIWGKTEFIRPTLWGSYDQIINDPHSVNLVFNPDNKNNKTTWKTPYVIGYFADIPEAKKRSYGLVYEQALQTVLPCIN